MILRLLTIIRLSLTRSPMEWVGFLNKNLCLKSLRLAATQHRVDRGKFFRQADTKVVLPGSATLTDTLWIAESTKYALRPYPSILDPTSDSGGLHGKGIARRADLHRDQGTEVRPATCPPQFGAGFFASVIRTPGDHIDHCHAVVPALRISMNLIFRHDSPRFIRLLKGASRWPH